MNDKDWILTRLINDVDRWLNHGAIENWETGEFTPVSSMTTDEKFGVLERALKWTLFRHLPTEQTTRVINNALRGKPKEQWLEPLEEERKAEMRGGRLEDSASGRQPSPAEIGRDNGVQPTERDSGPKKNRGR
jgi:hypothetical protein